MFSVYNVNERQRILENSIGALPEEQEAYIKLLIIVSAIIPVLIVASTLQFFSYYLFQKYFHPFKDIVNPPKNVAAETERIHELLDIHDKESNLPESTATSQQSL